MRTTERGCGQLKDPPTKALRPEKERELQFPVAAGTVLALLHGSKAWEGRARPARAASNPRTFAQRVMRDEAGGKKKKAKIKSPASPEQEKSSESKFN